MAKISISAIMARKNKLRILTILTCFLLVAILSQIIISRNPFSARAFGPDAGGLCVFENGDSHTYDLANQIICEGHDVLVPTGKTLKISGTHTFKDITVDGGTLIMAGGPHILSNLIVKNNGSVTHDSIVSGDIDTAFNNDRLNLQYLRDSGDNKKVHFIVTNNVRLENGGRIETNAKGFPGGQTTDTWGMGPGAGAPVYSNGIDGANSGGGGGSHGGLGGRGAYRHDSGGVQYYSSNSLAIYDVADNPVMHGSGGGTANARGRFAAGAAGGGVIIFRADNLFVDTDSKIEANGSSYNHADVRVTGGPGAGGSINITVNKIYTRVHNSYSSPSVIAGVDNGYGDSGQDGAFSSTIAINNLLQNIKANGGEGNYETGSAGGGMIRIDATGYAQICRILSSDPIDYIPDICEVTRTDNIDANKDVLISGKTIKSDYTKVWQEDGTHKVCPNPTTRNINNFIYYSFFSHHQDHTAGHINECEYMLFGSGGPLHQTYYYVTPQDVNHAIGEDCVSLSNGDKIVNPDGSASGWLFANDSRESISAKYATCDSKRHLKSLSMQNNARLTHSAPTYAESTSMIETTTTIADDSIGTGRWKKVDLITDTNFFMDATSKIDLSGLGYPAGYRVSDADQHFDGYGPHGGRGEYHGWETRIAGQGGGNAGKGGDGWDITENSWNNLSTYSTFDFGSGGGAALYYEDGLRGVNGANGGGRVRIKSHSFTMKSGSEIITNGNVANTACTGCSDEGAGGGGGAGGSAIIEFIESIDNDGTLIPPSANGGGGANSSNGILLIKIPGITNMNANVKSNGGAVAWSGYSGGGGGGVVVIRQITKSSPGIKKQLVAVDRAGSASFNPYGLQKDDIIEVQIEAHNLNLGQVTTIEDEILSTQDQTYTISRCEPNYDGNTINDPDNFNTLLIKEYDTTALPKVRWKFDPSAETVRLIYRCKVQ